MCLCVHNAYSLWCVIRATRWWLLCIEYRCGGLRSKTNFRPLRRALTIYRGGTCRPRELSSLCVCVCVCMIFPSSRRRRCAANVPLTRARSHYCLGRLLLIHFAAGLRESSSVHECAMMTATTLYSDDDGLRETLKWWFTLGGCLFNWIRIDLFWCFVHKRIVQWIESFVGNFLFSFRFIN